jgi:hypothetical protein
MELQKLLTADALHVLTGLGEAVILLFLVALSWWTLRLVIGDFHE